MDSINEDKKNSLENSKIIKANNIKCPNCGADFSNLTYKINLNIWHCNACMVDLN